jgi:hypothetical protein
VLTAVPYLQGDPQWAETHLDNSEYTIWGSGCFLTTLAMATATPPPAVNDELVKAGELGEDGKIDGYSGPLALGLKEQDEFDYDPASPEIADKMVEAICGGLTLVGNVRSTYAGHCRHFVLVVRSEPSTGSGIGSHCRFKINDPARIYSYLDDYYKVEAKNLQQTSDCTAMNVHVIIYCPADCIGTKVGEK